ncbi:MAG: hypothetical protein U0X91_07170 [Spirosomataceae bacterium]
MERKEFQYKGKTNLPKIEPHRLKHLILEDLERYGKIGGFMIGKEIPQLTVKTELDKMAANSNLLREGINKHTKYSINGNH